MLVIFLLNENVNIFLLKENVNNFFDLNVNTFHWTKNINKLPLLDKVSNFFY